MPCSAPPRPLSGDRRPRARDAGRATLSRHRNIKRLFAQYEGSGRKFGLDGGVRRVRLEFAGTHHRGIDDARNIARLLAYALGRAEFPRERS